jgi:hypothetical protein
VSEEWQHREYAERDLADLEGREASLRRGPTSVRP